MSSSAWIRRPSTLAWRAGCDSAGLTTVQYVSPQVWAWRRGRVQTIARAVDAVLCLLPFEPDVYRRACRARGVRRSSAGRPDSAGGRSSAAARAERLGFAADERVIAVLPGSRHGRSAAPGCGLRSQPRCCCASCIAGHCTSSRRWPANRLARVFQSQLAAVGAEVRLLDRAGRCRAGCRRCGTGGVRYCHAADPAAWRADGRWRTGWRHSPHSSRATWAS